MSSAPIEFHFDFSSPYGYLASTQIDKLAARHGRTVAWWPFLLGVAFKVTGQRALTEQPLRGPYAERDFARSARLLDVPYRMPPQFPFFALAASRACIWIMERTWCSLPRCCSAATRRSNTREATLSFDAASSIPF